MAKKIRLIARLDVKDEHLVKGIQYEGLRKLGAPHDFAVRYYEAGIDELLYLDTVASLYGRNNLSGILQRTSADVFIPVTAGGGVRSVQDVRALLRAGADKVAVNTAALKQPALITAIAQAFGRQCMVLSMQVKKVTPTEKIPSGYEIAIDGARVFTGMDAVEWAKRGESLGAGEICVNSIDCDGTHGGYDLEITGKIAEAVNIPVIASGGAGKPEHLAEVFTRTGASAGIISSMLYSPRIERNYTVQEIKESLSAYDIPLRPYRRAR